jgi:hypothetical protein
MMEIYIYLNQIKIMFVLGAGFRKSRAQNSFLEAGFKKSRAQNSFLEKSRI